jgi:membrane fusion protein (multidrug efflux system)
MPSSVLAREAILEPPQGPAIRTTKRLPLKRLALAGAAIALLAGAAWYGHDWWTTGRFIETTDDAYVGGNVTSLAPHVSGFIAEVLVSDNQPVRAGQVLIRLDSRDFQAALGHAIAAVNARHASLDGLRAQYTLQQSTIRQQEADLASKVAQLNFSVQDADRYRSLALTAAGSRQDAQRSSSLEQQARNTVLAASATREAGRQQLKVLEADIAEAEANLVQSQSDLRTAQLNLGYTEIRAPIDGYVGNRAAQVGAYVTAGAYLLSVSPSRGLWVDANFKEDQLTHMVDGDAASVVADVLPDHVFHGHVASVAPGTGAVFSVIPAENATGNFTKIVQRVPVRILLDADDPDLRMLRPGLSTTTRVDTRSSPPADAVETDRRDAVATDRRVVP